MSQSLETLQSALQAVLGDNIKDLKLALGELTLTVDAQDYHAIALTLRGTRQTKAPKPDAQVRVKRADRVRLVKLPPEETP